MKTYNEFEDGDWNVGKKHRWKKMHPKEVRGIVLDESMLPSENRKENRELRKRLARRQRRLEKRNVNTNPEA